MACVVSAWIATMCADGKLQPASWDDAFAAIASTHGRLVRRKSRLLPAIKPTAKPWSP